MIAFVGRSVAGNFVESRVFSGSSQLFRTTEIEDFVQKDCGVAKFSAYVDARSAGFNHEEATSLSWNVYFFCMSENDLKRKPIGIESN